MTTEVEQVQATKWCSRCFFEKPINEFSLNNGKKDGHQTYCKLCKSILDKDYKTKNADKLKEYQLKSETSLRHLDALYAGLQKIVVTSYG